MKRELEGVTLISENQKKLRIQHEQSDWGLLGCPQGHWNSISSEVLLIDFTVFYDGICLSDSKNLSINIFD